jgi:hypothetical protein
MNITIKILFSSIMLFLLMACNFESKNGANLSIKDTIKAGPPAPCEEYSQPLDIIDNSDTLKILIESSDCGEWGGHRELIYLQRNSQSKIFARFIIDTVSCDKIVEKGGFGVLDDRTRVIVLDTSKLLSVENEKLISMFLQRLLELYLKDEMHANAGSVYQVINTDATLSFKYCNSGDCRDTYYDKVRKEVFGDILKIKY